MKENLNGKRILITGGAGRVGRALIPLLQEHGSSVTILDNFSRTSREIIPHFGDEVELIEGDVTNEGDCEWAVTGSDAVIHLAQVHQPENSLTPYDTHEVNVGGTLNILEAMLDAEVWRLIILSSPSPSEDNFLAATLAAARDYAASYGPHGIQVQQVGLNGSNEAKKAARSILDTLLSMLESTPVSRKTIERQPASI